MGSSSTRVTGELREDRGNCVLAGTLSSRMYHQAGKRAMPDGPGEVRGAGCRRSPSCSDATIPRSS